MTDAGGREMREIMVPARSRATMRVGDLYRGSLSMRVTAGEPVCCERATCWSDRRGGTCSTAYGR